MAAADAPRAAVIFLPLTLSAAIGSFTRGYDPGLERRVGPHITVAFPSRPARTGALEDRLWEACRTRPPILVDFDAVLDWPDGASRIIALRVGEGRDALVALNAAAELAEELVSPRPGPYVPHLTLATALPPSVAAQAASEAERFVGAVAFEIAALSVGWVDGSRAFHTDTVLPLGGDRP